MNQTSAEPTPGPPWTTRKLLAWTASYLAKRELDAPKLASEMLLAHVLGVPRLNLFMDADRPASPLELAAYRQLIERAANHEPVQYLVGKAYFFSMELKVTPDVLIPRNSTETLVEHIMQHARRSPGFHEPAIADVGTGSGAIACALARNLPASRVIATDLSQAALKIARENAEAVGVTDRVEFRHGDLLEPLAGAKFQYLASNPPYIPDDQWQQVAPNVKDHEPTMALRGGADGLDCLRRLIGEAHHYLARPGQLVVEIAYTHRQAVLELVERNRGLTKPRILADHEGLDRVLVADRAG